MLHVSDQIYEPFGTGDEGAFDPQQYLEMFYYSVSLEHRITMPYDLRDHFETNTPDFNDQFVFFMLAFFDTEVKKTEEQKIDLGFSALLAIGKGRPALWINRHSIIRIQQELQIILGNKNAEECAVIFEKFVPDRVERARLFSSLKLMNLLNKKNLGGRNKRFRV